MTTPYLYDIIDIENLKGRVTLAKNKALKYLPLYWVDVFTKEVRAFFGNIDVRKLRVIADDANGKEAVRIIEETPVLRKLFNPAMRAKSVPKSNRESGATLKIDCMSLAMLWAENKQVYSFDKDFIEELLRTDTLTFTKNGFDYLPYEIFYIDLSDHEELCQRICGEGFFVKATKLIQNGKEQYHIHCCKVARNYFFNNLFNIRNEDYSIDINRIPEKRKIDCYDLENYKGDAKTLKKEICNINVREEEVLVCQILSYLSSVEPDIDENPETKVTYHKPTAGSPPKNKFSEVRKWDVGVRFGNAFRSWKKQKTASSEAYSGSGSRTKQRPHSRSAHWSHYWYGHGENKVRRAKWVSAYYVGLKGESNPAVIHKVI